MIEDFQYRVHTHTGLLVVRHVVNAFKESRVESVTAYVRLKDDGSIQRLSMFDTDAAHYNPRSLIKLSHKKYWDVDEVCRLARWINTHCNVLPWNIDWCERPPIHRYGGLTIMPGKAMFIGSSVCDNFTYYSELS